MHILGAGESPRTSSPPLVRLLSRPRKLIPFWARSMCTKGSQCSPFPLAANQNRAALPTPQTQRDSCQHPVGDDVVAITIPSGFVMPPGTVFARHRRDDFSATPIAKGNLLSRHRAL